jgi:hypothetical protein
VVTGDVTNLKLADAYSAPAEEGIFGIAHGPADVTEQERAVCNAGPNQVCRKQPPLSNVCQWFSECCTRGLARFAGVERTIPLRSTQSRNRSEHQRALKMSQEVKGSASFTLDA